ncbi:Mrp/NBP35 family ATP-binding protein [Sporobolomyces salmoneus]|uniref:Mrp/NBP35 family ATP-binding protein n=1 Tax=Sporobolomyces salmoneus TaxID=183962 RepID=UPI00317A7D61
MSTPFNTPEDSLLLSRLSQISHVLLVLSGKGGVGKSSVSVQLALSLLASDPKLRIGLLDVDLTGPSLPKMLGIQDREVLSSRDGWVPVYLDTRTGSTITEGEGQEEGQAEGGGKLKCMSIGFLLNNSKESVVWRGPKKNAMIKQFLGKVSWGELDYLIVDTPPGTSDEHISLLETLRPLLMEPTPDSPPLPTLSSLLVSTPQALALLDVSKELSFVRRTKLPLLGLIENMSGYVCPHCGDIVGIFGQGGGESFCQLENSKQGDEYEGGCRFLGRVPIDRELVALLDDVAENGGAGFEGEGKEKRERKTLVERYREIPSFKVVKSLAEEVKRLIEEQTEEEVKEGRRQST